MPPFNIRKTKMKSLFSVRGFSPCSATSTDCRFVARQNIMVEGHSRGKLLMATRKLREVKSLKKVQALEVMPPGT